MGILFLSVVVCNLEDSALFFFINFFVFIFMRLLLGWVLNSKEF